MKKLALHWWILIAMLLGVAYGTVAAQAGASQHVADYISPWGNLFLNLLKMIAVPLVLFSLVAGVASLNDMSKIGRMGGKTLALYIGTTAVAITIGLVAVNIVRPGGDLPDDLKQTLRQEYSAQAAERVANAEKVDILDQLLGIVPSNPFDALANAYNGKMLQVVFFALLLGVALTRLRSKSENVQHVVDVFQLLSDAIIEMVHLIMKIAPYGVFALMAGVVADLGKSPEHLGNLLAALLGYMGTVVFALLLHVGVYAALLRFLTKVPLRRFFRAMIPAQLLAFSSSSSAATLPVTIDCVENGVGVDEEATSFVLPLGATVNMDGTGLYQGVAAVFIATVYQIDLTLGDQVMIVLTATLASIGTAAVPGVGIVMLTIVLAQIEVPAEGIALILGVDRPLDMCRTVLNITGDATVCTVVASSEGLLHEGERHHDAA